MKTDSTLTDKIPKVIHYCWFGGATKSDLIQRCISSWSRLCPEYKIIEWNEGNWDIQKYPYARDAYKAGKWAFVSDVARLDILYNHGGIYLDTDVELLSKDPFSKFLIRDAFFAFENERAINTGMCLGTRANNQLILALLQAYEQKSFNAHRLNNEINTAINKPVFHEILGVEWNDRTQIIDNTEIISTGKFNSFALHYGTRTWDPEQAKYTLNRKAYKDTKLKRFLRNPRYFKYIEDRFGEGRVLKFYTFLAYDLLECGLIYFAKRLINKLRKKV